MPNLFGIFLQDAALINSDLSVGLLGLIMSFLIFFILIFAVLYIYLSLAYFAIAKKARLKSAGLAWIPGIGPLIIAYQTSKMHWWPWLLIIGFFIPFVGFIFSLVFTVFSVIWQWKMFETIGRPGWWGILTIIPIVNLVLIGIAAWGKNSFASSLKL